MHLYYDQNGQPMTLTEWVVVFEDTKSRIIARDKAGYGQGKKKISTVWMGLNLQPWHDGPPLIFETAVFIQTQTRIGRLYCESVWMEHTATREDAQMVHIMLCQKYKYNRYQRRKRLQRS